jgi:hypothetical protein
VHVHVDIDVDAHEDVHVDVDVDVHVQVCPSTCSLFMPVSISMSSGLVDNVRKSSDLDIFFKTQARVIISISNSMPMFIYGQSLCSCPFNVHVNVHVCENSF